MHLLYQPARNDFSIFWGLVTCGVALAIVLQMEIGGYQTFAPLAGVVLVLVLAVAALQLWRTRLTLTATTLTFGRILPSNAITLNWADIHEATRRGRSITVRTANFGAITFMRLGKMDRLTHAFATHGLVIDQEG